MYVLLTFCIYYWLFVLDWSCNFLAENVDSCSYVEWRHNFLCILKSVLLPWSFTIQILYFLIHGLQSNLCNIDNLEVGSVIRHGPNAILLQYLAKYWYSYYLLQCDVVACVGGFWTSYSILLPVKPESWKLLKYK